MPGGGWLAIRGIECALPKNNDGGGVEISVRDTGPGIAAGDLPHIFDAGFSTRAGSSGLGLAVCQRILAQHGGSIAVESRPGHGATFRLRLPRNGTLEASEHLAEPAAEPTAESESESASEVQL
jgi:signal transduction histidine kinase